jgi:outer membrane protein
MLREAPTNQPARCRRHRLGAAGAALLLLTALTSLSASLAAEPTRIGYVDMKRLFDHAPQVVAARDALDQEFRPRNEALLADEARLERLHQDLIDQPELDAEGRFDLERQIRNLRRSIDRRREDLSEELRFRTNAEKKALEEVIEIAVRQVAESGDYALILTSPVAYAAPTIDITDLILDWLENDFPNGSSGGRP